MLSPVLIEGIATTIPQRISAQTGDNFRRQLWLHRLPRQLRFWFGSTDRQIDRSTDRQSAIATISFGLTGLIHRNDSSFKSTQVKTSV
jgi:hypothetical protein